MSNEHIAETLDRLHQIVGEVVAREGFELVDLELSGGKRRRRLRVMIDRAGRTSYAPPERGRDGLEGTEAQVGIRDCVRVSKALSPVLDVEDPILSAYDLEVSSPGVDRPLKTTQHFQIAVGHTVRIKTRVPIDGESFFIAPLIRTDDDGVFLSVRDGETHIPFRHIRKARLEVQI